MILVGRDLFVDSFDAWSGELRPVIVSSLQPRQYVSPEGFRLNLLGRPADIGQRYGVR